MRRQLVNILTAFIEAAAYVGACVGIALLLTGVVRAFWGG